jgi:putative ABC transport system permease protein
VRGISGDYLQALGARLEEGRGFLPTDTSTSEPVVLVTEDFARRHVQTGRVIGSRVKIGDANSTDPWRTIVGVIANIRHSALDREPRPEVWLPFSQMPDDLATRWLRAVNVVARTAGDPVAAIPALRAAMRKLDPNAPLVAVQSLEDLARISGSSRRMETSLLSALASIALTLAAIGLFGVLAFYVAQHVPEFGVRLALGATPAGLLGMVLRRGMTLLGTGLAIGVPGAWLMGRGMSALLYGVEPMDPVAVATAIVVLALVTAAACGIPARRAMKTDPIVALRND